MPAGKAEPYESRSVPRRAAKLTHYVVHNIMGQFWRARTGWPHGKPVADGAKPRAWRSLAGAEQSSWSHLFHQRPRTAKYHLFPLGT